MYDANVRGTERVLDAAVEAGVARDVYVSTGNVYGNTHRHAVDESYERPQPPEFLSYYDETKYQAHQVALDRISKGAPVVIAMPGGVYGPDDPSELGNLIDQTRTGKLKLRDVPRLGLQLRLRRGPRRRDPRRPRPRHDRRVLQPRRRAGDARRR